MMKRSARTGRASEREGMKQGVRVLCQSFSVQILPVTPAASRTNGDSVSLPSGTDTLPEQSRSLGFG